MKKCWKLLTVNKYLVAVIAIFLCELFLRFYQMDVKSPFGYDQVADAWAAKNIIVNHRFPLVGAVAKANSGLYVGPLYRYFIAITYWIYNLSPIASAVFAGITSIFTFWVIFFIFKKFFSAEIAIIGIFLNTFIIQAITFDRIQSPVNFIPSISLIIFYLLYRIMLGDIKKIPYLAAVIGISFNIHFTSVFYPILVFLGLPFFPWSKRTFKYILFSLPLLTIWIVPNIIWQFQHHLGGSNFSSYFFTNFNGFHLRRVIQLVGDGLIQFNPYLNAINLPGLKYALFPLFFIVYLYKSITRPRLIFSYLIFLWFIVPWFLFATYKGEITDYYFSINRFIALFIISYFIFKIWIIRSLVPKFAISIFLIYIVIVNLTNFFLYKDVGLFVEEKIVRKAMNNDTRIEFEEGVPESYIYYYLMRKKGIIVYK